MIFVDTCLWVAWRHRRDDHHAESGQPARRYGAATWVTTNHVQGETWTYLRRRAGHRAAVGFLDTLERSPRVRVVRVAPEVEDEALRWLRVRDEREYSFVDGTSFAAMRSMGIREALAFDGEFTVAGFVELRAR